MTGAWRAYQVVLRLRSPMHIGRGKVGNLQRTRPYVTGRVLWGALTMRLTRDGAKEGKPAIDSRVYREVGEKVHRSLAFTYFYPALESRVTYQVAWPWENESSFQHRFLSSYQSTALSHTSSSASDGSLHEVEFLSPRTIDKGERVFLMGYVFESNDCTLPWESAFQRLQLGGERGYGWGDVELSGITPADEELFGGAAFFKGDDAPNIHVPANGRLLAHALTTAPHVAGNVEPLVGREWRSDVAQRQHVGQYVAYCGVCFSPGCKVGQELNFSVGRCGIWHEN